MNQNDYYQNKICIVTGANSGIGYALSEDLLNRGATVYMLGRNPEKVAKAAEQLATHGDRVHTLVTDVTKQEQVQKAIEGAAAESGRLDMLFNNAGIGGTLPYETATLEDWKKIVDTNLWSVIYGVHAAVPIMLKQGSGHIVNTSSLAGLIPFPMQALYSVTKFGVTALSECLRYEYAEKGVHFSAICPSNIATPIFKKSIDGTVTDELPIPADAIPADKAASYILDRVAEHKGIIVVPEVPHTDLWRGYTLGMKVIEGVLLQVAHDRRVSYETGSDTYLSPAVSILNMLAGQPF
jgi:NAD(P)-dependent dehydrogenase (short-subunit alcohol dehydrogenase family)